MKFNITKEDWDKARKELDEIEKRVDEKMKAQDRYLPTYVSSSTDNEDFKTGVAIGFIAGMIVMAWVLILF